MKRNLANDAKRARDYRRRKKDRLRRKQDDCFRATLETFYRDNDIAPEAWILLSEFMDSQLWLPHQLFFQRSGIEPMSPRKLTTIEMAEVVVTGEVVQIIRPMWFLEAK